MVPPQGRPINVDRTAALVIAVAVSQTPYPTVHPIAHMVVQAACPASSALSHLAVLAPALPHVPTAAAPFYAGYSVLSVLGYFLRRGSLHRIGALEVARRHFIMWPGWPDGPRGKLLWLTMVVIWLVLFTPVWPLLELMLRPAGLASFFVYYPKAAGCGILVERLPPDSTQVLRVDWHRFSINVGKPGRAYAYGGTSRQ